MIGIRWNKCGGCHGYGFLNETSFHHSFLQRCQAPEFRPVWRSSWLDEPANDCNWKNEAPTVVLISSLRIYFDIYIHFYTTMPAEFMICIYIYYIYNYTILFSIIHHQNLQTSSHSKFSGHLLQQLQHIATPVRRMGLGLVGLTHQGIQTISTLFQCQKNDMRWYERLQKVWLDSKTRIHINASCMKYQLNIGVIVS